MNLYHLTTIDFDGNIKDEMRQSFNAFDCVEEWFFENEEASKTVKKLTVEFVRVAS